MNRGSLWWPSCYAEAEARFNEAPIHESGKCGIEWTADDEELYASMRPRFMNRGSLVELDALTSRRALQ